MIRLDLQEKTSFDKKLNCASYFSVRIFVRILLNSTKERLTSLRKTYEKILKEHIHKHLIGKREELRLSQVKMADKLIMDTRSYVNLDHGKSGCSSLTLALYLINFCEDPKEYLDELRDAFEDESKHTA